MPNSTATEELFELIIKSGLLTADRLVTYREAIEASILASDKESVLKRLVTDSLLTPFQAKHLLSGRYKGFFIGSKYKLLAHLGSGGMGQVYLCEHLLLQRLVAVKVLKPMGNTEMGGALERFFREARAVAALDHPNIARLFDMDRVGGFPFMVMEYVDGANLHGIVTQHGNLAIDRAMNYVLQVARGLEHAHANGLVHRDIKPGNLLLDRAGTVKILDLGVARFFVDASKNENLTKRYDERNLIGTADFIAPEQTNDSSAVDIRADLYSLGCTLYFFLSGKAPFEDGTLHQKLLWHQLKKPTPISQFRNDIPTEVIDILEKLTAKEPGDRYQTPTELITALGAWKDLSLETPSREMPKMKASSYKLGIMTAPPDPSGTAPVLTAVSSDPTPIPGVQETQNDFLTGQKRISSSSMDGFITSGSVSPRRIQDTEPMPNPLSGGNGTRNEAKPYGSSPRWKRYLAFVGVQTVLLMIGLTVIWYLNNYIVAPNRIGGIIEKPNTPKTLLKAGGSTLALHAMEDWSVIYSRGFAVQVDYEGIGSGKGIDGVLNGRFDFACTDAHLTDSQLQETASQGKEIVHIPVVMGAVVPTYNLPEVKTPVRFSGPILAEIFLGKITKWNDPRIQELNKQTQMPDREIVVVHRSDDSGTTFIWTDFLNKSSEQWSSSMKGPAKSYKQWPVGIGVEKSEGMVNKIGQTPGAIGYAELSYALQKMDLSCGSVLNREKFYVQASPSSVTEAAKVVPIPADLRFSLTDPPGEKSYPISGCTWIIFDAKLEPNKRIVILDFLDWVTHHGQNTPRMRNYAPLPENLVLQIEAKLNRMRINIEKEKEKKDE